jgi:hypothetical protein
MDIITIAMGIIIGLSTAGASPALHPDGPTIVISRDMAGAVWVDELSGKRAKRWGGDRECFSGIVLDYERAGGEPGAVSWNDEYIAVEKRCWSL